MKLKNFSLMAGVIALTLTAAPYIVKAQDSTTGSPSAQTHPKGDHGLNLTADQKAKIKAIRQQAHADIKKVQNLSPDQEAQIKSIREKSEKDVEALLTPQQLQKFQQWKQKRHQHHQQ